MASCPFKRAFSVAALVSIALCVSHAERYCGKTFPADVDGAKRLHDQANYKDTRSSQPDADIDEKNPNFQGFAVKTKPTKTPSKKPTRTPTKKPSASAKPTKIPTKSLTKKASKLPSMLPTKAPFAQVSITCPTVALTSAGIWHRCSAQVNRTDQAQLAGLQDSFQNRVLDYGGTIYDNVKAPQLYLTDGEYRAVVSCEAENGLDGNFPNGCNVLDFTVACSAPSLLVVKQISSSTVTLSVRSATLEWGAGAEYETIHFTVAAVGSSTPILNKDITSGTEMEVTGLEPKTEYVALVQAQPFLEKGVQVTRGQKLVFTLSG